MITIFARYLWKDPTLPAEVPVVVVVKHGNIISSLALADPRTFTLVPPCYCGKVESKWIYTSHDDIHYDSVDIAFSCTGSPSG